MNSVRPSDEQLPRAGDVVAGKYRVESVIGRGGMGVVLGAEDMSLGRRVAIKFLAPGKARNDEAAARFVREARAAASLQSEHVVRVFEVGSLPNGASYIVMEHLVGGDLAQVLAARGPLPIHEAVDYLLETCEALGEAHKLGIIHRDLKPQNLFVTRAPDGSPFVKVLDFGISKAVDEAAPNLTATNAVMGTPLYMSPEQVRSLKSVDLRSDIWALGAILFELITAARVFDATSTTALCAMIAMDPPTPLRARHATAPPELEAIILCCLHKDPNGRFADVAGLADALLPFASERGRASAARVSRVVRGGYPSHVPLPGTSGLGLATTGQLGSTHDAGQQQTMGPRATEQRRSSSALFAVLGVMTGLLLLALLGGAGLYVLSKSRTHDAAQAAADATTAADAPAAAAAPTASPAAPTTSVAVATSTTTAPPRKNSPGTTPAATAPKDAAADTETEAARIARLKHTSQARCSTHASFFRGADVNAARTVKNMTCLGSQSLSQNSGVATCDRANCRKACTLLNDKSCLLQLDAAERGNPLPF